MVLVRPPLNNWPRKSVSNTNVKAEFYIKRISTVDILLISSCFRLSDKWNPGIISRFLQIYFMVESKSLYSSFLHIFPIHTNRFRWKTWFFDGMGKSLFVTPFVEWCHEDYLFFFSWHFWHSFRKWSFDTEVRSTFLPWTQLESPKRLFITVFSKQRK